MTGRLVFQMVTIIDPHIKRDSGYHIHQVGMVGDRYLVSFACVEEVLTAVLDGSS